MKPIQTGDVQELLENYVDKPVYIHVETTNGAYASHFDDKAANVGAYVRNAQVTFSEAKIVPTASETAFRAGLKLEKGWIYAEGLTDWEMHGDHELLLAGHDDRGRLMVALQISEKPFRHA